MTSFYRNLSLILLCVCALLCFGVVSAQDEQPEPDDIAIQREKHEFFATARTACAMEFLVPYGKQEVRVKYYKYFANCFNNRI